MNQGWNYLPLDSSIKYAYDFIKRDCKRFLSDYHFGHHVEIPLVWKYVRLLKAEKADMFMQQDKVADP
ncbi:MAG: hypothetical protein U9Q98_09925 [Bacteroidota bacterium]|nr:hypothetical protein [Bacteroidota bacterium]